QAEALGTTDLNGGALFNAEFGIRHRGSTVPERSGVALSFCRRPASWTWGVAPEDDVGARNYDVVVVFRSTGRASGVPFVFFLSGRPQEL
ncbi:hypothetical protein ACIUZM_07450, partial [Pseudomonas aeruginosa]|uniref:hypothetical protein n=1 Tax=Pseudomonas aeruginosa TaxID=287 RepID=UPI002955A6E0